MTMISHGRGRRNGRRNTGTILPRSLVSLLRPRSFGRCVVTATFLLLVVIVVVVVVVLEPSISSINGYNKVHGFTPMSLSTVPATASARRRVLMKRTLTPTTATNNHHRHNHRHWPLSMAIQDATFGMGCFWEPSESLLKVPGVVDTVVGYTGHPKYDERRQQAILNNNRSDDVPAVRVPTLPSYESVCSSREWVEAVRVTYDDTVLSYTELLDIMFEQHKAVLGSRQYASIIFVPQPSSSSPTTQQQQQNLQMAEEAQAWYDQKLSAQTTRSSDGWKIEYTAIEPSSTFYQAEGYHQQYWQKQRPRLVILGILIILSSLSPSSTLQFLPSTISDQIPTIANGCAIAIGLYITSERFFDSKVIELS